MWVKTRRGITLQIFGTDLDDDAIIMARKGVFPINISANVSKDRLNRFFTDHINFHRINSELREMVVFAPHNVIKDPPFTRLDIISCRNFLIYIEPEIQKKLLTLFQYSLNPAGILILGNAETLGSQKHIYKQMNPSLKLFRKNINEMKMDGSDFSSFFQKHKSPDNEKNKIMNDSDNIQSSADKFILQNFSPASVLVTDKGDIVYITGRTGKFLEPASGKANLNIFAMARRGLQSELPSAFRKVIQKNETVILQNIVIGTNGGTQSVNVTIQKFDKPESLKGMIIVVFNDAITPPKEKKWPKSKRVVISDSLNKSEIELELARIRDELQNTNEEMQTSQELLTSSNEELQSTNEELQSTNEEFQSTNEELITSKEEMQSLNEELQTLNTELQSKVDDFTEVNNDLKNLLDSLDIAILFVDKNLKIRRFTKQASTIFKLIEGDIGRPFTDIVSKLDYKELQVDAQNVLHTLISMEKSISSYDGRWFTLRIIPYRTVDDRIDGLVITFSDTTIAKKLEAELNNTIEKLNNLNIHEKKE